MSGNPLDKYNDTENKVANCVGDCPSPVPLALSAYTFEQINAVINSDSKKAGRDTPSHTADMLKEQSLPYSSLDIPGEAGAYAAMFNTDTHIPPESLNKLKSRLSGSGSGDYRLYYSGNGTRDYIEQRIDKIFGRHLTKQTRETLISRLEGKKAPSWIDVTDELHEAMKNTIDWVIEQNPNITTYFEQIIKNTENSINTIKEDPLTGADGHMQGILTAHGMTMAQKEVFMNAQLADAATGAPELMKSEAKTNLFLFVLTSTVGFASIAMRPAIKATRATKNYFYKHQHIFQKGRVFRPGNNADKLNSFKTDADVPKKYSSDKRFKDLAFDPAHGRVKPDTRAEAAAGLQAESKGLVTPPISRGPKEIEFWDGNGNPIDVKAPPSAKPGQRDFFDANKSGTSILKELREKRLNKTDPPGTYPNKITGKPVPRKVILNSTYLNKKDHKTLWDWLNKNLTKDELDRIVEVNIKH